MIPMGVDRCDTLYLSICEANNGRAWADRAVCLTLWEFSFSYMTPIKEKTIDFFLINQEFSSSY